MNIIRLIKEEIDIIFEAYKDSLSLHLNRGGQNNFEFHAKYKSDSLVQMVGRGTGHFGSGTYFSSYKEVDNELYDEYLKNIQNNPTTKNKPITELNKGIYMVDLDYYKLYKPANREHAELLFNVLKKINRIVSYYYNIGLEYNLNKSNIIDIINDLNKLDLKLPNLRKLIDEYKKINKEIKDGDRSLPSLSTRFMEYNGYNGVNLNHIPGFDNTLHGTVIYDLTKTINPVEDKKNSYNTYEKDNLIYKIIKSINKYSSMYSDYFINLDSNEINYIFNTIDSLINISNIEYCLEENKITEEQYNHILKIYPKYIKRLINLEKNLDFDYDTIIFLLNNNINIFDNLNEDQIYNIIKTLYFESYKNKINKNILNNFLNTMINKYPNDEDIVEHSKEILEKL
jgi:hypothetical protein